MGLTEMPVTFIDSLAKNSNQEYEAYFDHAIRIKRIFIWFVRGCENTLSHKLTANDMNLFKTIKQETIVGDDLVLDLPVDYRFDRDVTIKLKSINSDSWVHTVYVILTVEVLCK